MWFETVVVLAIFVRPTVANRVSRKAAVTRSAIDHSTRSTCWSNITCIIRFIPEIKARNYFWSNHCRPTNSLRTFSSWCIVFVLVQRKDSSRWTRSNIIHWICLRYISHLFSALWLCRGRYPLTQTDRFLAHVRSGGGGYLRCIASTWSTWNYLRDALNGFCNTLNFFTRQLDALCPNIFWESDIMGAYMNSVCAFQKSHKFFSTLFAAKICFHPIVVFADIFDCIFSNVIVSLWTIAEILVLVCIVNMVIWC